MSNHGQGSLNGDKNSLMEPLSHTKGWKRKDTTSLGFGVDDEFPRFDRMATVASELEDDDQPIATSTTQEEEFMPSTFLLWGEEPIIKKNDATASTSRQNESDEFDSGDPNRGRIKENIARQLAQN